MCASKTHFLHFCNVNSLRKRRSDIRTFLSSKPQASVLALCETKTTEPSPFSIKVPGYIPINCPFTRQSSGIVLYVLRSLTFSVLPNFPLSCPDGSMLVCVEICLSPVLVVRLAVVYVHPNAPTSVIANFMSALAALKHPAKPLLVLGDFNARMESVGDSVTSPKGSMLESKCDEHGFSVLNGTCCFGVCTREESILDLALTTAPDLFTLSIDKISLCSDHDALTVSVCTDSDDAHAGDDVLRWDVKNADWEGFEFACHLAFTPTSDALIARLDSLRDPIEAQQVLDAATAELVETFNQAASQYVSKASLKEFTIKRQALLRSLLNRWHALRRRARRARRTLVSIPLNEEAKRQLAASRVRLLEEQTTSARCQYEAADKLTAERDWLNICRAVEGVPPHKAIKAFMRTVPSSNMPLNSITRKAIDDLPANIIQSLDNMAEFYSEVMSPKPIPDWSAGPRPAPQRGGSLFDFQVEECISSDEPLTPCPELDVPIAIEEVYRALKGLGSSTAPGPDEIPSLFLKKSPPVVRNILTAMFSASWRCGVLPRSWRHANSFCLYKNGNRSDPSSYRIISITSIISRAFERIVKERLTSFLEKRSFFAVDQAGFRHALSTLDHIYLLRRDTLNAMRRGKQLPTIFLDIIKAFDRVPHDKLLYKLFKHAGITGKAWAWLRSFLSDRTFCITQGSLRSKMVSASAGVPQGAVLSPLLFIIYINDIVKDNLSGVHESLFADDIAAWPPGLRYMLRSQYKDLRHYLAFISDWSRKWLLSFSVKKSALVVFSHKRYLCPEPKPLLRLRGKVLPMPSFYKYLGHSLDADGGYRTHFHAVLQKVRLTAYYIGRVTSRNNMPSPITIYRIVKTVLLPQATYGEALIPFSASFAKKLTQIIAHPLRKSLGLSRTSSAARVLWEFGLYDVHTMHLKHVISFALRSQRSLDANVALASELARDMQNHVDLPSARYCLPLTHIVRDALAQVGLNELPKDKAALKLALDAHATKRWLTSAKPHHQALKPTLPLPSYLHVDSKPAVSIRARIRLSCALSFDKLLLYKKRDTATCDFCGIDGTIEHLLMGCPRFDLQRMQCIDALLALSPPVELSMNLLKGLEPVNSTPRLHKQCLGITATFLVAVSNIHFL